MLLQPSPHVGRCQPEADDIERQQECSSSSGQWWQQSERCAPPPLGPGRASWPGDRGSAMVNKGGAVVSGELVNGMLLMSPHGRSSWRPPPGDEEEPVDLTEPRLEAFTQPAVFR